MTLFQIVLNLMSYGVYQLATLIAWPNRNNAPGLTAFPFFVAGYLIPLIVIDLDFLYSKELLELLTQINVVGAISLCIGLYLGKISGGFSWLNRLCGSIRTRDQYELLTNRLLSVLIFGVIGVTISFAWMNVVPAFAEDPFLAKYFRGPYKEKYDQISILFRLSQFAIISALPIAISVVLEKKKIGFAVVVLICVAVLALSLTRAPVLDGVLALLAILAGKTKKRTATFLFFATLIYAAGSAIYAITGLVEGGDSIFSDVASGAPDIIDHLNFLNNFDINKNLNYGATFVGGLIPGNNQYNPAVYSLNVASPMEDIADAASGGFRMPPSIWGYSAFGWIGVILVPAFSGYIIGRVASNNLKRIESETSIVNKMLVYMWYVTIVGFFSGFYVMFYFGLLSIFVYRFVVHQKGSPSVV